MIGRNTWVFEGERERQREREGDRERKRERGRERGRERERESAILRSHFPNLVYYVYLLVFQDEIYWAVNVMGLS